MFWQKDHIFDGFMLIAIKTKLIR